MSNHAITEKPLTVGTRRVTEWQCSCGLSYPTAGAAADHLARMNTELARRLDLDLPRPLDLPPLYAGPPLRGPLFGGNARVILKQVLKLLRDVNDHFLPAHTREHVLAAHDLVTIASDELGRGDPDDGPCLATKVRAP